MVVCAWTNIKEEAQRSTPLSPWGSGHGGGGVAVSYYLDVAADVTLSGSESHAKLVCEPNEEHKGGNFKVAVWRVCMSYHVKRGSVTLSCSFR